MAAVEREPGVWTMVDSLGREYGRVEIRRTPDGIRYRTEAPVGTLIGWGTTLRQSCSQAHHVYLSAHGPGPDAAYYTSHRSPPSVTPPGR